jgi:hypothetical protein
MQLPLGLAASRRFWQTNTREVGCFMGEMAYHGGYAGPETGFILAAEQPHTFAMAVLDIVTYPDPRLREPTFDVKEIDATFNSSSAT